MTKNEANSVWSQWIHLVQPETYRPQKITFHAVVFPVYPRDETL